MEHESNQVAGSQVRNGYGAARALWLLCLWLLLGFVAGCDQRSSAANEPVSAPPGQRATASPSAYEGNQWAVVRPGEQAGYNQRQTLLYRGKQVYQMYCVGCHGEAGDGNGPAAARLITKPRDFTKGIFKFRSTDSSSLPMESDLYRTITRGLARVSMPSYPLMPEHDKVAVIQYVKTFYPDWEREAPQRTLVAVPRAPENLHDTARMERGRLVYVGARCAACHGTDGAGKNATQVQYIDAWGHPQRPFDFTRGRLKGGDDPEDIYRTFHAGLRSIMPAFGPLAMVNLNRQVIAAGLSPEDQARFTKLLGTFPEDMEAVNALSDAQRQELVERNSWDLVAFVMSLRPSSASSAHGSPTHD